MQQSEGRNGCSFGEETVLQLKTQKAVYKTGWPLSAQRISTLRVNVMELLEEAGLREEGLQLGTGLVHLFCNLQEWRGCRRKLVRNHPRDFGKCESRGSCGIRGEPAWR